VEAEKVVILAGATATATAVAVVVVDLAAAADRDVGLRQAEVLVDREQFVSFGQGVQELSQVPVLVRHKYT
jgi:hypothetical protein